MANREQLARDAAWQQLQDDPKSYFEGCELRLFPNGQKEIWIKGKQGGMCITASEGPMGLGIEVKPFLGNGPITIHHLSMTQEHTRGVDTKHVSLTLYHSDEKSQAFKQWVDVNKRCLNDDGDGLVNEAHEQGITAAKLKLLPSDCPHTDGKAYSAWMAGYWEHKAGMTG